MDQDHAPVEFYVPNRYTVEDSVGALTKRVMSAIVCLADRRLEAHGLTHAQWLPLFHLLRLGNVPVAELAREQQADAGAMTRLLDRLEKKGLCRRVRSTEDRRVVVIELTDEGRALAKVVPGVLSAVQNELLAGFTRDEWQTLLSLLRRMGENGQKLRQAPARTSD